MIENGEFRIWESNNSMANLQYGKATIFGLHIMEVMA